MTRNKTMPGGTSCIFVVTTCFLMLAETALAFQSPQIYPERRGYRTIKSAPERFTFSHHELAPQHNSVRLNLFFGKNEPDTKEKELVFYPKLATANADVKFESMVGFIETWSKKFEEDRKGMGLTTPVKVEASLEDESEPIPDLVEAKGVRILFQPTKTTYKSRKEEDAVEKDEGETKKKRGPPKEGGVQIRVEKLTNGEVQLRAARCNIDEDTMIKEMSEEVIVSQLKQAVDAWKKQ